MTKLARFFQHDLAWIIAILLLALLVRIPYLAEPSRTIFDEVIYANNTIKIVEGVPWIDPHPYFARSLFGAIAENFPFSIAEINWQTNASFGDFPYLPLRLLMIFFGTLVPVLLYALGRGLGLAPPWAGVAGILAAIEPGFIIFSRIMVPDMMLIAFGFAGLSAVLAINESVSRRTRIVLATLAGIFFGVAISIKWTALGLLATGVFMLFLLRRFILSLFIGGIALCVYITAFLCFFSAFSISITSDHMFPSSISGQIAFLPELTKAMATTQTSSEFLSITPTIDPPITWAVGATRFPLWLSDDKTRQITLLANPLLWTVALLLFVLALVAHGAKRAATPSADIPGFGPRHLPLVLAAGYLGNYMPFFFIERPMYLYHYFIALAFLYLALPWGLREAWRILSRVIPSHSLRVSIAGMFVIAIVLIHVTLISFTYGI